MAHEAAHVVDVHFGAHHHLGRLDEFVAIGTVCSLAVQVKVIPLAEFHLGLLVESSAQIDQFRLAPVALETLLVPELVAGLEHVLVMDCFITSGTVAPPWLGLQAARGHLRVQFHLNAQLHSHSHAKPNFHCHFHAHLEPNGSHLEAAL